MHRPARFIAFSSLSFFDVLTLQSSPFSAGLVELYNITADPYEYHNLAADQPATVRHRLSLVIPRLPHCRSLTFHCFQVAALMAKLAAFAASPDQVRTSIWPAHPLAHNVLVLLLAVRTTSWCCCCCWWWWCWCWWW